MAKTRIREQCNKPGWDEPYIQVKSVRVTPSLDRYANASQALSLVTGCRHPRSDFAERGEDKGTFHHARVGKRQELALPDLFTKGEQVEV